MTTIKQPQVQPTLAMPSADLITYRFDQTDKKLEDLKTQVTNMTATFATNERVNELEKRLDGYTWFFRAVIVALLSLIVGVIVALVRTK